MLIITNPATLDHDTVELLDGKAIRSYECPERIHSIISSIMQDGSHYLLELERRPPGQPPDTTSVLGSRVSKFITETHDAGYLKYLQTVHRQWVEHGLIPPAASVLPECYRVPSVARAGSEPREPREPSARPGYYSFDMSTGIAQNSWPAIMASAELAAEAVSALFTDPCAPPDVMALCRPPGHHCTTKMAGGYCYLNNAVVAVQALRQFHKDRISKCRAHDEDAPEEMPPKIAILDIDFHHGNGTQDYFYSDPSVVYVSIHGRDEYPYYTGHEDERGAGDAEGTNVNLTLAAGSSIDLYLEKLDEAVKILRGVMPQYLVVSLGFDTYCEDPLGSFGIRSADYQQIGKKIRGSAGLHGVPAIILLEGGYVVEDLGENLLSFLRGWENRHR